MPIVEIVECSDDGLPTKKRKEDLMNRIYLVIVRMIVCDY
jgi:hypothetical protein